MDKISHAFLDLLEQKDYRHVTVNDIMERAGLPRTSFYNHYDSKEDLAKSILVEKLPITFNYISRKFLGRQSDQRVTAAVLNNLVKDRQPLLKLWAIKEIHTSLEQELEKKFSQETLYIAKRRWPNASAANLSFFSHLFAMTALQTMEWYLSHPTEATAEQIAQQINICMYDGIIKLVSEQS